MPFKTKNGELPIPISRLLQQCCALLSRNVWINWGKKVKGAQGNRSPFFFIAVNFDKGSSVSSSPPPFIFLEGLCAKLHYSSSPWYCHETRLVCLPENRRFSWKLFLSQQLLPLSPQTRKEEEKGSGSNPIPATKHPWKSTTTLQTQHHENLPSQPSKNPFTTSLRTTAQLQTHERCSSQPQFATLRLGKKTPKTQHPISGIVLKYFLSGNSFFSCSPSWQPEPSGSCQQGRSSSGVSSISSLFTALLRKKPIDAPVLRFGTLEGLGYSTNQPFLNTCQRSDLMPFSAHHTKRWKTSGLQKPQERSWSLAGVH